MGKKLSKKKLRIPNVMAVKNCTAEEARGIIRQGKLRKRSYEHSRQGVRDIKYDKYGNVIECTYTIYRPKHKEKDE